MQTPRILVLVMVMCAAAAAPPAAAEPSDLRRHMGDETFETAGLEALNADQLAVLEQWLRERGVLPRPTASDVLATDTPAAPARPAAPDRPVVAPASSAPPSAVPPPAAAPDRGGDADETRAVIAGAFEGWTGRTYFSLNNGQIWQQRTPGRYSYRGENLEVRIYKNRLGFHMLEVVETGRAVGVRRVQ